MTQAQQQKDLSQYINKKVIVTVAEGDDGSKEYEGKVEAGNDLGLLLKIKGKSQSELLEADTILDIVLAPEKPKKISVKTLDIVELGKARQHLADRHGIKVSELNDYDEEKAFQAHAQIDHSDLGHKHEAKKDTPQAQATEAAEAEQSE